MVVRIGIFIPHETFTINLPYRPFVRQTSFCSDHLHATRLNDTAQTVNRGKTELHSGFEVTVTDGGWVETCLRPERVKTKGARRSDYPYKPKQKGRPI